MFVQVSCHGTLILAEVHHNLQQYASDSNGNEEINKISIVYKIYQYVVLVKRSTCLYVLVRHKYKEYNILSYHYGFRSFVHDISKLTIFAVPRNFNNINLLRKNRWFAKELVVKIKIINCEISNRYKHKICILKISQHIFL